jgi:hypothetical protein
MVGWHVANFASFPTSIICNMADGESSSGHEDSSNEQIIPYDR